jgi:peptidoglycan hydrolase-like protein with peptidoglycan-binding domain
MRLNTARAARFLALILAAFLLMGAVPGYASIKKIDLKKNPLPSQSGIKKSKSLFELNETFWPTLRLDDKGEKVTNLQNKLHDLGYLKGKADGEYGYLTERAVWLFKLNNDMEGSGVADSSMQKMLYGGSAKSYSANLEKNNDLPPLIMAGRLEWKAPKSGKVKMRVKIMNADIERTVDNFTVRCWFEDAYGERVSGGEIEWDNRKKVKPGKVAYSDYHTIPYAASIYTCHFAISRAHMTNGDSFYPTDDEPLYMNFVFDP